MILAADLATDLVAVGHGDRSALCRVYDATNARLLAICMAVTGERASAEDVLQETFVKVWSRAHAFDPARASATAWLGAIARNSAIDWYRARRRQWPNRGADGSDGIADPAEPADERLLREEREDRAVSLLGELPDDLEADIRNVFLKGLTYRQLAHERGLPMNTVKSRIRRTLLLIRSRIADD